MTTATLRNGRTSDAAAFLAGLIFALGLGIAGMTDARKVIGFLDLFGHWDPSLLLVMAGAIAVHLPFLRWWQRRQPAAQASAIAPIDRPLVMGSALFGIGWGLAGYCPGPAIVSLSGGGERAWTFVLSMMLGMALFLRWRPWRGFSPGAGAARG